MTTFNTPSGNPASENSSANFIAHEGSFSDGFNINVFPQAIEIGYIHMGTIAGKLNGVMPAQMPSGCLIDHESMFVPTFCENSPFNKCGMPQANSITSKPLVNEPLESSKVFPCSLEIISANLSILLFIKSLYLDKILDLFKGVVLDHSLEIFFELSIA